MDAQVALNAARQLSVDVANLGLRVALLESERQFLSELASMVGQGQRMMRTPTVINPDDLSPVETVAVLSLEGEQVAALDRLLSVLNGVS